MPSNPKQNEIRGNTFTILLRFLKFNHKTSICSPSPISELKMDKIIAALNEDASCKGWIICQQDGKIIDSVGILEQKKEIAQSMHRIFCEFSKIIYNVG